MPPKIPGVRGRRPRFPRPNERSLLRATSVTDLFALTCLRCPICEAGYLRGATIRIAARFCVGCERCEYHCRCGAKRSLQELPPVPRPDEPLVLGVEDATTP
jgi:hypothetical protein